MFTSSFAIQQAPAKLATDYNELLTRSKAGNAGARERLFRELQVRLRSILKYRLRGWAAEDIEDVLQDTLVVVSEKLNELESNPDYFALSVLRNKIGNVISRHRRRLEQSIDPTDYEDADDRGSRKAGLVISNSQDDFRAVEDADVAQAIRVAVRQLSQICQALFTALLEQRTVAETWELFQAAETGLNRSAFDKRLFDCRRKLRRLLAGAL
jgi:DNA-directed RNA polymerase specialized sigma24 family protein